MTPFGTIWTSVSQHDTIWTSDSQWGLGGSSISLSTNTKSIPANSKDFRSRQWSVIGTLNGNPREILGDVLHRNTGMCCTEIQEKYWEKYWDVMHRNTDSKIIPFPTQTGFIKDHWTWNWNSIRDIFFCQKLLLRLFRNCCPRYLGSFFTKV